TAPQYITMVKCETCGNDSTQVAAFYWKVPDCLAQGCWKGYLKCKQCIYLPTGHMLKCCGFCSDALGQAGRRVCTTCKGTGIVGPAMPHGCLGKH
ncbi:hypothetical protein BT67DRAFT_363019, partial [Trichocladium antarcticum]